MSEIKRLLQQCVHCGLCLPACPTYQITGQESESPRGRIYLTRAALDGEQSWESIKPHIDLCLGCLACETACPSGVQYGPIVEFARANVEKERNIVSTQTRKMLLDTLEKPKKTRSMMKLMNNSVMTASGAPKMFSMLLNGKLSNLKIPQIPNEIFTSDEIIPAVGERHFRVGMLLGCVMRVMYPEAHRATIEVLTRSGCEVYAPNEQECCGALWLHNGYPDITKSLAKKLIKQFNYEDYVIVNSAGCGSTIKEYGEILANTSESDEAQLFSQKTKDLNEFLVDIGFPQPQNELDLRVGYHDACHLAHGQQIRSAPRQILESIPGVKLIELEESDRCCGSAGIYNLTQPEMAKSLLNLKIDSIIEAKVDRLASANPGCTQWIAQGLKDRGVFIPIQQPVEILAESYHSK